jgi:hydroxyethylthiazole kinase-like sugar kinase family protein
MSKKAWIICSGCLIAGLVIGYFVALAQAGSTIANTLAILQLTETGQASDRAYQAYQHESSPVAIYAFTEALDRLKTAEDYGATPIYTKQMMAFDGLMLHGRLAKLYLTAGQTNLCE